MKNQSPKPQPGPVATVFALVIVGGVAFWIVSAVQRHDTPERRAAAASQAAAAREQFQRGYRLAAEYVSKHRESGFIYEIDAPAHKARVREATWDFLDVKLKQGVVLNLSYFMAGPEATSPTSVDVYSDRSDKLLASRGMFGGIEVKE